MLLSKITIRWKAPFYSLRDWFLSLFVKHKKCFYQEWGSIALAFQPNVVGLGFPRSWACREHYCKHYYIIGRFNNMQIKLNFKTELTIVFFGCRQTRLRRQPKHTTEKISKTLVATNDDFKAHIVSEFYASFTISTQNLYTDFFYY